MPRLSLIVVLISLLAGCGTSPKTHFYVLNAEHQPNSIPEYKTDGVGIGLWRVKLPKLLDRPEIVTRTGQYRIDLADFHQWAGGLGHNMTRLIANQLGQKLKTDRVIISPWSSYSKNDYQVKVFVDRFDGSLGNEVVFNGAWSLLSSKGNKELTRKLFIYKSKVNGKTYSDIVAALSNLTVQLTDEITRVIEMQE